MMDGIIFIETRSKISGKRLFLIGLKLALLPWVYADTALPTLCAENCTMSAEAFGEKVMEDFDQSLGVEQQYKALVGVASDLDGLVQRMQ